MQARRDGGGAGNFSIGRGNAAPNAYPGTVSETVNVTSGADAVKISKDQKAKKEAEKLQPKTMKF